MASISCVQTYGSNKSAGFFGYANGNYSYGYYNVTFNYSGISHDGGTLNISGANVNLKNPNSGYTTNTVYINSVTVNGTNVGLSASEKGNKSYHSFSTPSKNVSVDCGASATSCTVAVNCSRTGGGSQTLYGTLSFSSSTGSFNLNILLPDGSEPYTTGAAGSVEFSSNGGSSYTRLYNEPSNSYIVGTSFVCRNFSPGTGLHLSGTSGFNNNGGSGPWRATQGSSTTLTFNTAWNTYTMTIRRGTGIADIISPAWGWTGNYKTGTATYGDSFTINASVSTGYHWTGWTGTYTTSTQKYTFTVTGAVDVTANAAPNTYTIVYNANGGSGAPSNQTKTYNSNLTLSSTKPARANYDFLGWSTSNTATSATYAAGAVLSTDLSTTQGATVTLYAVWRESKPTNLILKGTVNGPFQISLNWSNTGINVSYKLYANGTQIYSGTNTSAIFNCAEETTYNFYYTATNKGGTTTSNTITLTTPADQAKIRIKKDGTWQKGKAYYKKDGVWVKAKKVYIKVNGEWKINNNYDS